MALEAAMMGRRRGDQASLFYEFWLDDRIPKDHLLRRIDGFRLSPTCTSEEPYYSEIGRPSVDPELMMRMLIIGYCNGLRSERRLVTLPVSARDRIDSQRQHVEICGDAPFDHAICQASVFVEVQLEEFRRADRRADVLDAYRPWGRNAEHGAELLGSLGDRPFTVMMEQPLCSAVGAQNRGMSIFCPMTVTDMSMLSTPARTLGTRSHRS
jgi:Transposase domain (DUF772)